MSSISEVRKDVRVCFKWILKHHKSKSAQAGSNSSDCQKYKENMKFIGNLLFFNIIHHKTLFVFL